jgi:hypothetical protein
VDGTKTLYFKTKNGAGVSNVLSDSIVLTGDSDTTPPHILMVTPQAGGEYTTGNQTVDLAGTAGDDTGVAAVLWNTDVGESGTALGTADWRIDRLPLHDGDNLVTVMAQDASGNQGKATLMVVSRTNPGTTTTVELRVRSRSDDCHEKTLNGMNVPYLSTSYVGSGRINGFRFQGVPIPRSAIILEARLWLNCRYYGKRAISICYAGELAGSALSFKGAKYGLSSRPRTNAEVADVPSSWVTGAYNASPDLSAIIQEIVDQSEWQKGNALAIFIQNKQSTSQREINNYDRRPALSAKLTITYYQP